MRPTLVEESRDNKREIAFFVQVWSWSFIFLIRKREDAPHVCHVPRYVASPRESRIPSAETRQTARSAQSGDRGARARPFRGFKVFAASWPLGLGGDYLLYKLSRVQRGTNSKLCGSHDPTVWGRGGTLTQDTPAAGSPLYICSKSMLCETQLFPGA